MSATVTEPHRVAEGDEAPALSLSANGGRTIDLATLRGRPLVLYFYPKADTSGCTAQARDFQAALPELEAAGTGLVGVSRDPMRPIERFAEKYGLGFPLASDPDGTAAQAYGAWVEKSMYGRRYWGIERSTFLIDRDGRIARCWRKVSVPGHVAEVVRAAQAL